MTYNIQKASAMKLQEQMEMTGLPVCTTTRSLVPHEGYKNEAA